jgi:hypothetical protein
MADGSIHWYRRPMTAAEIADQLRRFEERGIRLENGLSHRVTMLDATGEQVSTTAAALVERLALGGDVSFQLWLDASTDVYCRFRQMQDTIMVQTYGLNGLTPEERVQVRRLLWDAFGGELDRSDALVVDLYDRTQLVDWDAAVTAGAIPREPLPDLVAMRQPAAGQGPPLDAFLMISRSAGD